MAAAKQKSTVRQTPETADDNASGSPPPPTPPSSSSSSFSPGSPSQGELSARSFDDCTTCWGIDGWALAGQGDNAAGDAAGGDSDVGRRGGGVRGANRQVRGGERWGAGGKGERRNEAHCSFAFAPRVDRAEEGSRGSELSAAAGGQRNKNKNGDTKGEQQQQQQPSFARMVVTCETLRGVLGPELYESEVAARVAVPGTCTGLAWTPTGGELLFIECTSMPGSGDMKLTGKLGEVRSCMCTEALLPVGRRGRRGREEGDDSCGLLGVQFLMGTCRPINGP